MIENLCEMCYHTYYKLKCTVPILRLMHACALVDKLLLESWYFAALVSNRSKERHAPASVGLARNQSASVSAVSYCDIPRYIPLYLFSFFNVIADFQ